ncbi:Protein ROOT PRIMORDIUM DEFECTIVE 1, partial [Bienertia sinuspersici]
MLHKRFAAQRLIKLLMLTTYFRICSMNFNESCVVGNDDGGNLEVGLELVSWRKDMCVPMILQKEFRDDLGCKRGRIVKFPVNFAPGFDLQKKVKDWVEEWQYLPYISPLQIA